MLLTCIVRTMVTAAAATTITTGILAASAIAMPPTGKTITTTTVSLAATKTTTTATSATATAITEFATAVFTPQNKAELKAAVLACLDLAPAGNCSTGPHGRISSWDVSAVTDMNTMFADADSFNQDLSAWNVSAVTDMSWMFQGAISFNGDLSAWNVSAVVSMNLMFLSAWSFNGDLSAWDVSAVAYMLDMFGDARSFNHSLSAWDVSTVTDMNGMFNVARSFNQDLSAWDVSAVNDMNGMFAGAHSFNQDLSAWDVSTVTDMNGMFQGAKSFNQDLSAWDVSAVTDMGSMFQDATSFNQDLSAWDVSAVTVMTSMFQGATSFNQDLSPWDVSAVTDMVNMFYGATSFNQILCGVAWVHDWTNLNVRKAGIFLGGSGGSIPSTACTTTTTTAPTARIDLIIFVGIIVVMVMVLLMVLLLVIRAWVKRNNDERKMSSDPLITAYISNEYGSLSLMDETDPSTTVIPLAERTFANSNYKRLYVRVQAVPMQHNVLNAVENMLQLYAKRMNPAVDQHMLEIDVSAFMKKIQEDAFKNDEAMKNDVDAMAEFLWTSGKKHVATQHMELCSVLNAVIRDDIAEEIGAAAMIFRSINNRRVQRISEGPDINIQSYPPKGETWRGGGFRREHRAFFDRMQGQKYRVPGFLATSDNRQIAVAFAFKADKSHPCVIWRITFDPRGKLQTEYRVQHMSFVSKTLMKGENEYLFAPYSVFKLVSINWSVDMRKPHQFKIRAACDNKEEEEDLPLAPWY